jgi:hypothetical protein
MSGEPPQGLSANAQELWRALTAGRTLTATQSELLRQALISLDRADDAARAIAIEGAVVPTRFDGVKENPSVRIEATHRTLFARLMGQLNIDGVARQIGRPGSGSGKSTSVRERRLKAV